MSSDTSSCASLEVASEGSPDAPVKFPTSGVKVLTERGRRRLGELEGDKLDVVNFGHLEGEKFDVVNFKIEDHHDMRFNQHLCAQAPHKMAMSFGLDRQRSNWEFCAARLDSCGSGSTLARDFLYGVSGRLGREGVSPLGLEEMDHLDNWLARQSDLKCRSDSPDGFSELEFDDADSQDVESLEVAGRDIDGEFFLGLDSEGESIIVIDDVAEATDESSFPVWSNSCRDRMQHATEDFKVVDLDKENAEMTTHHEVLGPAVGPLSSSPPCCIQTMSGLWMFIIVTSRSACGGSWALLSQHVKRPRRRKALASAKRPRSRVKRDGN